MKSTTENLRKRGMAKDGDILSLADTSFENLLEILHDENPCVRSSAAINLRQYVDDSAEELLTQLSKEKCLYTKIAICESLENGNMETARKMTKYLGLIGSNQHRNLPDKVSAKKSFPLPRDIIARSLAKMDISIFYALIEIIKEKNTLQICEVLDSIGYMVFYNPTLVTKENVRLIISLANQYMNNSLVLWKVIVCLSAFPLSESKEFLSRFAENTSLLGLESHRSLNLLDKHD